MKGDSLEALYKAYMNDIYHYLLNLCHNPQTAEDLVQETFVRAYDGLESYSGERVRPWLFKTAHNAYIDWYRREKRQIQTDPHLLAQLSRTALPGPEAAYLQREQIQCWLAATDKLGEKSRQAMILRDYYGFTYQEIAEILGLSLANVKVTLYRARKVINEVIKDEL